MNSLLSTDIIPSDIPEIHEIIENRRLKVHFQPIVSLSRKKVIGFEGLIRGIDIGIDKLIPPIALFEAAQIQGVALEFDRICRDKVLDAYQDIYRHDNDKLLFLNLDTSVLDIAEGSNYLINQVKSHGINPRNIVIEINESKILASYALQKFCDTYRKHGFMVALDDVGTKFSNMDRLLLVKPDIIKIDISLIKNIQNDYYKQGVIKSLINLSNMIGALVIAEGVETEEECIQILRLGGHMMQGFYFAKPHDNFEDVEKKSQEKVEQLSRSFNQFVGQKIIEEKKKNSELNKIVNKCIKELVSAASHEFDNKLLQITWSYKNIECAYILDEYGIQVSNTIRFCEEAEVKDNLIFYTAIAGTDHTMEKYYYPLISARLNKYITEPYVSLATGNVCITISRIFINIDHKKYILCIDFNTNDVLHDIDSFKDINISNLVFNINGKSITELNKLINRMNEEIIKDSLTNTYNRRYLEERLLVDVFSATKEDQPISVVLADIDFFKKVNDTYGHMAGDHVLKEFAKIAKNNIRKSTDWIARYGGEEFLIVLLNADEHTAYMVSEKVRQAIEKTCILYNNESIRITASFGAYTMKSKIMTYEQLVDQADKNLYLAINSGRNKTISINYES